MSEHIIAPKYRQIFINHYHILDTHILKLFICNLNNKHVCIVLVCSYILSLCKCKLEIVQFKSFTNSNRIHPEMEKLPGWKCLTGIKIWNCWHLHARWVPLTLQSLTEFIWFFNILLGFNFNFGTKFGNIEWQDLTAERISDKQLHLF